MRYNKNYCFTYTRENWGRTVKQNIFGREYNLLNDAFEFIMRKGQNHSFFCLLLLCFIMNGCKKIVEIPEPINSITTKETFQTDALATSAIMGIYSHMSSLGNLYYSNGAITIFAGLSADELNAFGQSDNQFQNNTLTPDNGDVVGGFWTPPYFDIYMANAAIEGIEASQTLSNAIKKQLIGEAEFIRAFCHFYLVNLFGDVSLVTTTSWPTTSLMSRTPASQVYQQIISDLKDAQNSLASDYSISGDERTRANKWAATALLARVYLYTNKYDSAEAQANLIINNSAFSLSTDLNSTFLAKNNNEAIFQLETSNTSPYAIPEAQQFIPRNQRSSPKYILTDQLLGAFELGDQRMASWVKSTTYSGVTYYFPYKYKVRLGQDGNITEYNMVLRLAEQYLIRAEARAKQNNLDGAIKDLNVIRERAGLSDLSSTLNQSQVLDAISQENRIEFFAEWGHRWFDLKRVAKANELLGPIKGANWQATDELYPIPLSEIQRDPNLKQNAGY